MYSRKTVPIARVRETVARWAEQTSLRQAARETGMSPTGLRKVLDGTRLHASTERKLVSWYMRHVAQQGGWGAVDPETASAALELLTAGLPPGQRRAVVEAFLAMAEDGYRGAGLPVPDWIEKLRTGNGEGEPQG
ncbi:MAG TPA: hypothetical protein VGR37_17030 [Longimicrobiaceae bacterium]|nr:hypothetical protein [Longimicrobiaceae bacterium]